MKLNILPNLCHTPTSGPPNLTQVNERRQAQHQTSVVSWGNNIVALFVCRHQASPDSARRLYK